MRAFLLLILLILLQCKSSTSGPCDLVIDDETQTFDFTAWAPEYPLGFAPRHPQKKTFAQGIVQIWPNDILYPGKLGVCRSLNDTLNVAVRFVNADTLPLVITNTNVEGWVVPMVYEIGDQIETSLSLAGPPSVKWWVRYWRMPNGVHARPDTLFPGKDYIMQLDVWDVPEGKYQLAIMGTDSVPSWFDVIPSSDFYHMLSANSLADSINAWATIFERAMADGNLEEAKELLEVIFTHNELSTVGYYERAKFYWKDNDSTETVASFDSVLTRLDKWDDPALPDTTDKSFDSMNLKWKHFMQQSVAQEREMYINCPELR